MISLSLGYFHHFVVTIISIISYLLPTYDIIFVIIKQFNGYWGENVKEGHFSNYCSQIIVKVNSKSNNSKRFNGYWG